MSNFDVVIAGAGLVGAVAALACSQAGLRVALVERHPQVDSVRTAESELRVSALSAASRVILERLGVWQQLDSGSICAYERMDVKDGSTAGEISFDAADIGEPALGYIVFNQSLLSAMWNRVTADERIELLTGSSASALDVDANAVCVELQDGRQVCAQLVLGADGGESAVRTLAGISTRGWPYRQTAVVANIGHGSSHECVARQVFLPEGPLAFLPLADGRSSIVWSTNALHAEALLRLDEQAFLQELHEAFGDALGDLQACGPRASFPLQLRHALQYVRPRVALAGDAAHIIHPLAGQGVNLGFLDVAALVATLAEARAAGADIGSMATLRRYERWRKGENLAMMALMDGFKRLFGDHTGPLLWLRGNGMSLTNRIGPLKNLLVRRAMGVEGDLPPLARRVG